MRPVYWLLALLALVLAVISFGFFASPESQQVAAESLDQWYLQATLFAALLGGLAGLGGGLLVPRAVHSRPGEPTAVLHRRVVTWGLLSGAAALLLTLLVTLGLAYNKADWQLTPSGRVGLVAGGGKYLGVLGAAWLAAAVVFAGLVSARAWEGRAAVTGR